MTAVILHGHLGKRYGSIRMLDVHSPQEAVQALCATVPGFSEHALSVRVRIRAGDTSVRLADTPNSTGEHEIHIVPVLAGAKAGVFQMVLGMVLIVVGAWNTNPQLIAMGAAMMLGGLAQALMSAPDPTTTTGSKNSFIFSSTANVIRQGSPVPVLYGEMVIPPPPINNVVDTETYTTALFGLGYDGIGTWLGNGDSIPWGGSLAAL